MNRIGISKEFLDSSRKEGLIRIIGLLVDQINKTKSQPLKGSLKKLVEAEKDKPTVVLGEKLDSIIEAVEKEKVGSKPWAFDDVRLILTTIKMDRDVPFHLKVSKADFRVLRSCIKNYATFTPYGEEMFKSSYGVKKIKTGKYTDGVRKKPAKKRGA